MKNGRATWQRRHQQWHETVSRIVNGITPLIGIIHDYYGIYYYTHNNDSTTLQSYSWALKR
jgi:hypothetical protein